MKHYKESGVDLDSAEGVKQQISTLIRGTFSERVLTRGGEFGGVYSFGRPGEALVSSMDGVGTKLKVAILAGKHDTVGEDLVNHCINDIAVMGAEPLFFLDYLASGRIPESTILSVIEGLARGCMNHGTALIAGETAQMPGFYADGEYDLAGTIVGSLQIAQQLPRDGIANKDQLIGFRSSGLHTNGYSLARHIVFDVMKASVDSYVEELQKTWAEELLRVHKSYYTTIRRLVDSGRAKGLAHITGGGIRGNLKRILPDGTLAVVQTSRIVPDPVFTILETSGGVSRDEMFDVFNMGIGLVAVCSAEDVSSILSDERDSLWIGEIAERVGPPDVEFKF